MEGACHQGGIEVVSPDAAARLKRHGRLFGPEFAY